MDIYYLKYIKYKTKYLNISQKSNILQKGGKSNKDTELYLFKAEWCGHCKNFMPIWDQISKDSELNNKIEFIKYDSDQHKKEINEWNIKGFPTIILKKNDKAIEYNGPRKLENIKEFIKNI